MDGFGTRPTMYVGLTPYVVRGQDTLSNEMFISPAGELKYETVYHWDWNQAARRSVEANI